MKDPRGQRETAAAIGERVHMARKKAGISQSGLAKLTGLTRETIIQIELGANCPSAHNAAELARVLGVPVGWLITGATNT